MINVQHNALVNKEREKANPASVLPQREWEADDTNVQWSLWEGCDSECTLGGILHASLPAPGDDGVTSTSSNRI